MAALALIALLVLGGCAGSAATTEPAASTTSMPVASAATTVFPTPTSAPTPTPPPTPGVTVSMDVPFTPSITCASNPAWEDAICQLQLDIAAPPPGTGPHPLVVLLRGGPDKPHAIDYLRDTAERLADRGVVAMVADWRESPEYGGGGETALQDVACAVGVARQLAPAYGADPGRVTLVGHSLGAWAAGMVAFAPANLKLPAGQCNATAGSLRPDALVDLDGWVADVASRAPRNPKSPLPILIAHAEADGSVSVEISRDFAAALRKRGYAPELIVTPGGDHTSVLYDAGVLDAIVRVATGG